MPVGDLSISNFNIGPINLNDPSICQFAGINIYQDIYNPFIAFECRLMDHNDALKLPPETLNGKEKIELSLSSPNGGQTNYTFSSLLNNNMTDGSSGASGALKHKRYDLRGISPEYLNAMGHKSVQKSYNKPMSDVMEEYVKEYFGFEGTIEKSDPTKGKIKYVASGNSGQIFHDIKRLSISSQNQDHAYVLLRKDHNTMAYTSFGQLIKQSSKFNYTQSSTQPSSENDQQFKILDFRPSQLFNSKSQSEYSAQYVSYNMGTGKLHKPNTPKPDAEFKGLGKPVFTNVSWVDQVKSPNKERAITIHDSANNETPSYHAEGEQRRKQFLAKLVQNSAEMTVPANFNLKLGDVININIPSKTAGDTAYNESQYNGDVLVVGIRTQIAPHGGGLKAVQKLITTKVGAYDNNKGGMA